MSGITKAEVRDIVRDEISPIKGDISNMSMRLDGHDVDIKELKSDVKELKSDVKELKSDVRVLSVQFEDFSGKLDAVVEYIMDPIKLESEAEMRVRVDKLETDMTVVKLALRH